MTNFGRGADLLAARRIGSDARGFRRQCTRRPRLISDRFSSCRSARYWERPCTPSPGRNPHCSRVAGDPGPQRRQRRSATPRRTERLSRPHGSDTTEAVSSADYTTALVGHSERVGTSVSGSNLNKKQGATGITTVAPYVAGQWGRGDDRLQE